jgi:hypothetical protein
LKSRERRRSAAIAWMRRNNRYTRHEQGQDSLLQDADGPTLRSRSHLRRVLERPDGFTHPQAANDNGFPLVQAILGLLAARTFATPSRPLCAITVPSQSAQNAQFEARRATLCAADNFR